MLLDWITARVSDQDLGADVFLLLRSLGDRIMRFNPTTRAVVWETCAWDSVRSDTHGVTFRVGSDALWIQGSPARVEGDGCNVFGGVAAQSLDPRQCIAAMLRFLFPQLARMCFRAIPGTPPHWCALRSRVDLDRLAATHALCRYGLPDPRQWKVTRVDVTQNYALKGLAEVRVALTTLRNLEGGRYRVSQQQGDTIYFSHSSKMASGKVYAKGPHLEYLNRRNKGASKLYTPDEIADASKLLRFELKLGCEFFRHHPNFTPDLLRARFQTFFERMLGASAVTTDNSVLDRLMSLPDVKPGQAKAAFATWNMICSQGWQWVAEYLPRATYYRHAKLLRLAGLSDLDLSTGKVSQLRRGPLELVPVTSWDQLSQLRAA